MRLTLSWVFMHCVLMLLVVINLLTGLRIAAVHRPEVLKWSAFLPQGSLHSLHFTMGVSLLTLVLTYGFYRLYRHRYLQHPKRVNDQSRYHKLITLLGYTCLGLLLLSGCFLYLGSFFYKGMIPTNFVLNSHYVAALVLLVYIPLHAGSYFVQYGIKVFSTIFIASKKARFANIIFIFSSLLLGSALFVFLSKQAPQVLVVHPMKTSQHIKIDGDASEEIWATIKPQVVHTFGGENFNDGSTDIRVKVIQNGFDAFFHISWDDTSESISHLPLYKTEAGWKVLEDGFYNYDEKTFYEDKLAVIISNNCDFAAAGTAHLGPKPLADKPANWHGKGYHYTSDKTDPSIVDLWHWKAVRTNKMMMMDDNFFGAPVNIRPGKRRYAAGYQTDPKVSGAYKMNWLWYKPNGVVPKRMPLDNAVLKTKQNNLPKGQLWPYIDWDDINPYSAENDTAAIGSMLSSVLYATNSIQGDRADVRAFAQWHDGQWSLEFVRELVSDSKYDISLQENVCLWFAAFDHSQIAHTRHARPLQLKFK